MRSNTQVRPLEAADADLEIRTYVGPQTAVDPSTRRKIVDGLRRRDPASIEHLIEAYGRLIRSWSAAEGSESEDVVQEVLLNVWRAADRLEPSTDLPAFLKTVTQNALRNRRRTRARKPAVPIGLEISSPSPLGDDTEEHTERMAVQEVLSELSERERRVLELLYLSDLPLEEVAGRMDATREATKSLAARARRRLRSELAASMDDLAIGA